MTSPNASDVTTLWRYTNMFIIIIIIIITMDVLHNRSNNYADLNQS